MTERRASPGARRAVARLAAPVALGVLGLGFWLLSQGQPARFGSAIGPGWMARGLALGIVALAAIWGAGSLWPERRADAGAVLPVRPAQKGAGLVLLTGVLVFALAVPAAGLVAGAGLAAGFAARATGERRAGALAATMAALAALAAVIGLLLLPPTAPLWPRI